MMDRDQLMEAAAEAVAAQIRAKLEAAFSPDSIDLEDESDRHKGHGGWRPGGATHYNLRIVAGAFEGQSRVARQRAVMTALADELASRVHALSISAETPAPS